MSQSEPRPFLIVKSEYVRSLNEFVQAALLLESQCRALLSAEVLTGQLAEMLQQRVVDFRRACGGD
jgi:hypothetical protein